MRGINTLTGIAMVSAEARVNTNIVQTMFLFCYTWLWLQNSCQDCGSDLRLLSAKPPSHFLFSSHTFASAFCNQVSSGR